MRRDGQRRNRSQFSERALRLGTLLGLWALALGGLGLAAPIAVAQAADTTPPAVTISDPLAGYVNSLATARGKLVDNSGGSGADHVDVLIQRKSDGAFWTGTTFGAATFLPTTLSNGLWTLANGPRAADLITGVGYTLTAFGYDKAFNRSSTKVSVTADTLPPTVSLTTPTNMSHVTTLATIGGLVNDAGSGVRQVLLQIERENDKTYWNGSSFTASRVNLPTTVANKRFTRTSGNPGPANLIEGTYLIFAYAFDNLGQRSLATARVVVDQTPPTVKFTAPVQGAFVTNLRVLRGTAKDSISGVKSVVLQVRRNSDNFYFNGSTFTATPVNLPTTLIGPSSSAVFQDANGPTTDQLTDGTYTLFALATDNADNTANTSISVTVDKTPPDIVITSPTNGQAVTSLAKAIGTVQDPGSGIARVEIQLIRRSDNTYYNGSTFTATPASLPATVSGKTFSFTHGPATATEGIYTFIARAFDRAGNSGRSLVTVSLDRTAPTVAFTTPLHATFVNTLATINGIADDTGGSGVDHVYLQILRRSDGTFWNGTAFGSARVNLPARLASRTTFSRATGNPGPSDLTNGGHYTLYAIAVDRAGNARSATITVTVDLVGPVVTFTSPTDGARLTTFPAVNGKAPDAGVGTSRVDLLIQRPDGQFFTGSGYSPSPVRLPTNFNTGNNTFSYVGPVPSGVNLPDGTYQITAIGVDALGNNTNKSTNILIDNTAPTVTITDPADGTVIPAGVGLGQIMGTADDGPVGSDIASVTVTLRRSNGDYFNGSTFTSAPAFLPVTYDPGTNVFSVTSGLPSSSQLPSGDTYTITATAVDKVGNTASDSVQFTKSSTTGGGGGT